MQANPAGHQYILFSGFRVVLRVKQRRPKEAPALFEKTFFMPTDLELKAPKGKFRVIGVDTFDGTDWIYGDYKTKEEAISLAKEKGGTMLKTHVYDDQGKHIYEAGKF